MWPTHPLEQELFGKKALLIVTQILSAQGYDGGGVTFFHGFVASLFLSSSSREFSWIVFVSMHFLFREISGTFD